MPVDKGELNIPSTEWSISSASPRYLGLPSKHISILGAMRKCCLSRYSGLMSRDAISGSDDGDLRRPSSTSSTL